MEPASADKIRAGGWVDDKVTAEGFARRPWRGGQRDKAPLSRGAVRERTSDDTERGISNYALTVGASQTSVPG